jgi:cytochrome P450
VLSQCALLGVPAHDADRMQLFVTAFDPEIDLDEAVTAIVAFREFVEETIEQKRAHPADDLITDVVSSHDLTDAEILSVLFLLLGAGHNTTGSMLALGVFVLLARDQLETACKDQPSLERTVEELLRYVTVFPRTHARTALADVELAGVLIKAGEKVSVSLSAANRDPAQFEAAGALNVARPGRSHLAFGQGVHMCLGQHLARLEMQVALSGLLQRFPTLRLAMPVEEIRMHTNCGEIMTRGVYELPVGW